MSWKQKDIDKAFDTICNKIAVEGFSLRKCLKEDNMPGSELFYKWIEEDEDKSKRYARACSHRADIIFEEIIDIADDQEDDIYLNSEGVECVNHNVHARSKIRIGARQWMLGKMNPKKYSDKIQVDTTEFKEQPLFEDVPKNDSDK